MIELYTMDSDGVTYVGEVSYGDWMAFYASTDDIYVAANERQYKKEDLLPIVI